jgi:DNA polymerase-3 subunit delta'
MEGLTHPWIRPILDRLPRAAGALPRALLLAGRPGLGKRATALFLAQALLCETEREGLEACGTCASCRLYQVGNHPDLRMVEAGQEEDSPASGATDEEAGTSKKASRQISVEKIRTLVDFVTITSHRGGAKVILIAPAEAMHPSAANAVLKILEEPPGATYFLLVSHQPERLLPTIRSRCFRLEFALPDPGGALDWLKGQGIARGELALMRRWPPSIAQAMRPSGLNARPCWTHLPSPNSIPCVPRIALKTSMASWCRLCCLSGPMTSSL